MVHGIHHVTAICGDPRENHDFYVGVLGMRLVKRTVNQDVPDTYHLFYADAVGTPGTDLTFFPWPHLAPARRGVGLAVEIPLAIPAGSMGYWRARLAANAVDHDDAVRRFGEATLPFRDPHGLSLSFVESAEERAWTAWPGSSVPEAHQIRGIHAVRLWEGDVEPTGVLLGWLGFEPVAQEEGWRRFALESGGSGRLVDLKEVPDGRPGTWGTGGVHHVAWRAGDDDEQLQIRAAILEAGVHPTRPIDRFWFRSVYFREPGGALFELATDGPGFERDEPRDRLGEQLILPPWLESRRRELEAALPPLPATSRASAKPTPD